MPRILDTLAFFLDDSPRSAALNMAVDETLLRNVTVPILRVYRWIRPAVSFGYFEKFELVRGAFPKRECVRRWTGGGVVLHGDDLTYSLVIPSGHALAQLSATESYRAIHGALADALGTAGVKASVEESTATRRSAACFENPVAHDVMLAGAKIAGAAQRRSSTGMLHQGSIQNVPLPPDFPRLLATSLSDHITPRLLSPDELRIAEELAAGQYATAAWNERVR